MKTNRLRACVLPLAVLAALTALSVQTGIAQAAVTPEPAWNVIAATGPTNLPPKQSEVQRVTVGAEGGTFVLAYATGSGSAAPVITEGHLTYAAGSTEATIESVGAGASFEVGARVTGSGIPTETTIVSCSPDCATAGSTVMLSNATTAAKTDQKITIYTLEMTVASGTFHVGDEVAGSEFEYLPSGTTVTAVGLGTITLSKATNAYYFSALLGPIGLNASEHTASIAYDASPGEVQRALEALPSLGVGAVAVSGGPGGEAERPYFLEYGGSLADQNIAPPTATGTGLGEHGYVHVFTVVSGGPGTGEIAVFPSNVGGAATTGSTIVELGPLPAGVVVSGEAEILGSEAWSCSTTQTTARCTTSDSAAALNPTDAIVVPVQVEQLIESTAEAPVTVSGGGAARAASYQLPIVISSQPAQPGIAAFFSGALEANGEPSTVAGGHPYSQVTVFQLNTVRATNGKVLPAGDLRDIDVDLPAGLLGDPLVTERCPTGLVAPIEDTEEAACDEVELERYKVGLLVPGTQVFGAVAIDVNPAPIYNDVPAGGAAAQFTTKIVQAVTTLLGSVRSDEDFGVRVGAGNVPSASPERLYYSFTAFYGKPPGAHGKAFLRNPTDCAEEVRERPELEILSSTWQQPQLFTSVSEAQASVTGCSALKFEPEFSFEPSSTLGSSGVGATAHLHMDQSALTNPEELAAPDLKTSVVTLPEGLTVNPSQASGLEACTEAQVGYLGEGALPNPTRFDEAPVTCPEASKLGSVEIVSPLLESPLEGTIYLAAQEENPFHSLIALYLVVESERFGVTLKLPGKVEANAKTGQLTATFDYIPQQPVEDLTLRFRGGGPRSEFATPEVCGAYSTNGVWTPWSAPESGPPAQTSNSFTVSSGCAASASARAFAPGFEAGTTANTAGGSSAFVLKLTRNDGEQMLGTVSTTLPRGLIGMVSKVAKCPEAQANAGDCPASSQVGHVNSLAGVGGSPLSLPEAGKQEDPVYFTGPYDGAPFGLSIVVHPEAGPFNLEEGHPIVVRAALSVNPETAQVSVVSGAIPTILRGIPLDVRGVTVTIDRPGFMVNPTSCEPMSLTGTIDSGEGAAHAVSSRFQAADCAALPFEPSLKAETHAHHTRKSGSYLKVTIAAEEGEANLGKVHVTLPKKLPAELETLKQACTEAQFDANPAGCPKASVVGSAVVHTPVLSEPLSGPAIYVSHGHLKFPDLALVLQGEGVTIIQEGLTNISESGFTSSSFEAIPDVPVSSIELVLPEGSKPALGGNGGNLCKAPLYMPTKLTGQNGAVIERKTQIVVSGCGPEIHVLGHKASGAHGHIRVGVPSAGKLIASGRFVKRVVVRAGKAKTLSVAVTLDRRALHLLAVRAHKRLHVKVELRFVPKHGKALASHVKLLMG